MEKRANFGSKLGIVLASAGSAVGLGNVWRFPTEVGANGGGAFILIYVVCVLLLGLPLMVAEFIIGRRTHANTADAFRILLREKGKEKSEKLREKGKEDLREKLKEKSEKYKLPDGESQPHKGKSYFSLFSLPFSLNFSLFSFNFSLKSVWPVAGYLGVFTSWFILCYYGVVAGWTLKYLVESGLGEVTRITESTAYFTQFTSDPLIPLGYMAAVVLMCHLVIVRGVQKGIERSSKLMMPLLLVIMVVLLFCSVSMPGAEAGIAFLLKPDFTKITSDVVLSAMGQAFFSLSIAMGCLCTYASYFTADARLVKTAGSVALIDTIVAVMSGFIIFPAVFSVTGVAPDAGPGLVFITLPKVFQSAFAAVPWLGGMFAFMFYLLLLLAALTSMMSIHEPPTAFLIERFGITRHRATMIVTSSCIFVGVLCSLSFGVLSDVRPLMGLTFFEFFDFVSAKIFLPVGGIMISLFTGWRLDREIIRGELTNYGHHTVPDYLIRGFIFVLKWLAPLAIALIFIYELR